jgi:hypothetical protein
LLEIRQNKKLSVSDNIRFIRKDQIVTDLFDIRKKDGSKFKRGYFNFGKCEFKKSENEVICFLKLVGDKNWKTEFNNGDKIKVTYIGDDPEYIAELKKRGKIRKASESMHLYWYIFAKFEDASYRFIGNFKIVGINENGKQGSYEAYLEITSEIVEIEHKQADVSQLSDQPTDRQKLIEEINASFRRKQKNIPTPKSSKEICTKPKFSQ